MQTTHNAYIVTNGVESEVFATRAEAEACCAKNEIEKDTITHRFATDLGVAEFAIVAEGAEVEDGDPIYTVYVDAVYNSLAQPGARTVVWGGETRETADGLVAALK